MITLKSLPSLFVLALAGCGMEAREATKTNSNYGVAVAKRAEHELAMPPAAAAPERSKGRMMTGVTDGTSAALVAVQPAAETLPTNSPAIARKIVYDAQVDLIVESVDPITKKVGALVQEARGYIAEQNVTGSPGSQRSMRWRVRIPVEQFDSFVDSIVSLGELERNNRTSQDVTEQYYDIEARIKNKKLEEQTLNKILQERSGKLEDILKIEIELSRVRGEIEQFEGKIRVLENVSSLATLTLNIREREKYAPPAPVVADFPTQIARTWNASLLDLKDMGKALTLWTVSWAIWIPFLLLAMILGLIVLRWLLRVFLRNLPRLIVLARTPITSPRAPTASERIRGSSARSLTCNITSAAAVTAPSSISIVCHYERMGASGRRYDRRAGVRGNQRLDRGVDNCRSIAFASRADAVRRCLRGRRVMQLILVVRQIGTFGMRSFPFESGVRNSSNASSTPISESLPRR